MANADPSVFDDALSLPSDMRAELAERLVQSLNEPEEIQLSPAWRQEIRRRLEAFDKGEMKAIPAEKVFKRLRNQMTKSE